MNQALAGLALHGQCLLSELRGSVTLTAGKVQACERGKSLRFEAAVTALASERQRAVRAGKGRARRTVVPAGYGQADQGRLPRNTGWP
jgi:hypothetical protein